MSDVLFTAAMFVLGGVLALLWLAALWVNVRGLVHKEKWGLPLIAGVLMRLVLVGAGFYLVIALSRQWTQLLAALAGFVAMRFVVLLIVRRRNHTEPSDAGDIA
ncbi:MAG: ATP synthase subunit I [Arenicellales bacterium]